MYPDSALPASKEDLPFELQTLQHANHYSQWICDSVKRHMGTRILELGAGIGNITQWLPVRDLLVVTEAEPKLMAFVKNRVGMANPKLTYQTIDLDRSFSEQVKHYDLDTIVSFNVLEHIEDDRSAIAEQVKVLKESKSKNQKRVIVFVPAHEFAYGSYDRIFLHHRRYTAKKLKTIFSKVDPKVRVRTYYFNLLSLPGWLFASHITKSTEFSPWQMKVLEAIIPFWAPMDWVLHHIFKIPLGQSVIAVAEVN